MRTESRLLPALLVLLVWGGISAFLADLGVYRSTPDMPPVALLAAILLPPILFAIIYKLSADFRAYVLRLDLRLLTAVQAWRVIGGMFLVLMTYRLLPPTFAWPAGIGDLIVGLYAPFVVLAIARRKPSWRTQVLWLNILGLVDFVGAIGGGVLAGNNPLGLMRGEVTTDIMQEFPLVLIPVFAVPAWTIVHIISLIQLRHVPSRMGNGNGHPVG